MENLRPGWLTRLPAEIATLPIKMGLGIADRFKAASSENRVGSGLEAFANPGPTQAADAFAAQRDADPRFFAEYETAIAEGRPQDALRIAMRKAAIGASRGEDVSYLSRLIGGAHGSRRGEFDPTAPNAAEQAAGIGLGEGEKGATIGKTLGDIFNVRSQAQNREALQPSKIAQNQAYANQANATARLSAARTATEDATRGARVEGMQAKVAQALAAAGLDAVQAQAVLDKLPVEIGEIRSRTAENISQARAARAGAQAKADLVPSQEELNQARAQAAREGRSSWRRDDFLMPGNMVGGFQPAGGAGVPGAGAMPPAVPAPGAQQPAAADHKAVLAEAVGSEVIAALDQGQVVTKSQLLAQLANRGIVGSQADGIIAELMQQYPE